MISSGESLRTYCSKDDSDHPATGQLGTFRVSLTGRIFTFGLVEAYCHMPSNHVVALSHLYHPSKHTPEQFDDAYAPNHILGYSYQPKSKPRQR